MMQNHVSTELAEPVVLGDVSLEPEVDPTVLHALLRLLAPDFAKAKGTDDLNRRLWHKGFQIRLGYLATMPHGKLICPLSLF